MLDCKTVRIFAYSSTREQSNKSSGMRLKTESETGGFFSLASHALRACEARALRARNTLTPHFTDFFTDFEKKTDDCFAVYTVLFKESYCRKTTITLRLGHRSERGVHLEL